MLVTGGTLDTTPPYKRTPGDGTLKGQKVISGACFHPCYAVPGIHHTLHSITCTVVSCIQQGIVAPVAYQVILEPGIGQFREFEPRRVHTGIKSLGLFLVHKLTCGKRESVS